jgi:hypothetical protein
MGGSRRPGSDDRSARKQQAATTGPGVANQESHARSKQQCDGCRQPRVIRLAHRPGDAVVPPGAARLLSAWHRRSRHDDAAVVEAIMPGHGLSGAVRPLASQREAVVRCAMKAVARPVTSASRGPPRGSPGRCSRPAAGGETSGRRPKGRPELAPVQLTPAPPSATMRHSPWPQPSRLYREP